MALSWEAVVPCPHRRSLYLLSGKSQSCMLGNTKIGDILGFQAEVLMVVAHVVVKHQVFMKKMK